MPNTYTSPESVYGDADNMSDHLESPKRTLQLIPSHIWNVPYLLQAPGALNTASLIDPARVVEGFAQSAPQVTAPAPIPIPSSTPSPLLPSRLSAPPIPPFNGSSSTLRFFCTQLLNQMQDHDYLFPSEISKFRFAYQCLGPGALIKMRSCFRCLEDPKLPSEINTLSEFISALRRQCQDPSLEDKAMRAVEVMTQKNTNFQDFKTAFEDNMADSSYASFDKSVWKTMFKKRLSYNIRDALLSASYVTIEYHSFVSFLRRKDTEIQEMRASFSQKTRETKLTDNISPSNQSSTPQPPINPFPSFHNSSLKSPIISELTVSQGGSAMDLDAISRQRGPDGRLTVEAKNARRSLGRCYRCNEAGHLAINCKLKNKPIISVNSLEDESIGSELKE